MIVVAGAGIVGSAIAWALRHSGREVILLEKEAHPGMGISSRNSGVIHSGLYYPPGSLKDRMCREGRTKLYDFCEEHDVTALKTGKYLVAMNDLEEEYLHKIKDECHSDVSLFFRDPPGGVRAQKALFAPETGILDVHSMILALIRSSDATLLPGQEVQNVIEKNGRVFVTINGECEECQFFINACGFGAPGIAGRPQSFPLAKGSYFRINQKPPVPIHSLVYPAIVKGSPSLGTHLTIDLDGCLMLGPNLTWVDEFDYGVNPGEKQSFFDAAVRFLPWLELDRLEPGYVGYRPKLAGPEYRDFTFETSGHIMHCLGIESPGITASLAIGEYIRTWVQEREH